MSASQCGGSGAGAVARARAPSASAVTTGPPGRARGAATRRVGWPLRQGPVDCPRRPPRVPNGNTTERSHRRAAPDLAELNTPTPTPLRSAAHAYRTAIDDLTRSAGLAA